MRDVQVSCVHEGKERGEGFRADVRDSDGYGVVGRGSRSCKQGLEVPAVGCQDGAVSRELVCRSRPCWRRAAVTADVDDDIRWRR